MGIGPRTSLWFGGVCRNIRVGLRPPQEDSMHRTSIIATACAASLFSSVAFAQASAPMSREQVKAETRAAQKSGDLTPAGGGGAPMAKPHTGSKMTKEQRKAETMEARKKGELAP